jgi:hypothetical protein
MINITDIQRRLLENPEPQAVKDIRSLITGTFKDLEFHEGPHKYYLNKPDGSKIELPSVSGVIKQFEPEQDWDAIRKRKAAKEGIDPEVLKRQWRETNLLSTSNGTKTHFFLENLMNLWIYGESGLDPEVSHYQYEDGFLIPYGAKEKAGMRFYEEMVLAKSDVFPIMPEAKIYTGLNPQYTFNQDYCGTFDLLMGKYDKSSGQVTPFLMDWKGLPLDTPILTTTGFKNMGSLQIGDLVFDQNGFPTKVTHVSEIHYNPCYELKFDDGKSIIADQDHRWVISFLTFRPGQKSILEDEIMTTLELKEYIENYRLDTRLYRGTPRIKIASCIHTTNKSSESQYLRGTKLKVVFEDILLLREQRQELLRGVADHYGSFDSKTNRIILKIPEEHIREIETLIESLGLLPEKTKEGYLCFKSWYYPFSATVDPSFKEYRGSQFRTITKVIEVPTVSTKCIQVDSPTKTYLASHDLIVTHNTNKTLVNDFSRKNHRMMLPPFQDFPDEPLSHYTLQLSCYQMGIQQLGLPISHRIIIWLKDDGTYELINVPDVTDRLRLIL